MVIPRGVHLQATPVWQRRREWYAHPRRTEKLCPCGAPAERKPGLPRCEVCRAETAAYNLCRGCGGKRPRHINSIYCPACAPPRPPRSARGNVIRPCQKCGSREEKARGEIYCPECTELMREVREARYRAKLVKARKPCRGCGKSKGPGGHGNVYCAACRRERAGVKTCWDCPAEIPRGDRRRVCDSCRERRRRESRQRSRERIMADPELRAAHQRYQREYLRNRAQEQHVKDRRARARRRGRLRIPAKPLAAVIRQMAGEGDIVAFTEGLGLWDRTVRSWKAGNLVEAEVADRVLGLLCLNWWEVWDEERFPDLYSPAEWVEVLEKVAGVFPGERVAS